MRAAFLIATLCMMAKANDVMASEVSASGRIGPAAESWVQDYSLEVGDGQEIIMAANVRLEQGTVRFDLIEPQGNVAVSQSGAEFTSGPAFVVSDAKAGAYRIKVTAHDAVGKWQCALAATEPKQSAQMILVGGALMVLVAVISVAYWRWKSGAAWRWFWVGAGLWALGVAMKFAVAIPLNQPILTWLEKHLGPTAYVVVGSVYIGLLTGIFEVGIVGLAALMWRRMAAEGRSAVAVGVGAGAVEAALLGMAVLATTAVGLSGADKNLLAGALLMGAATPAAWLLGPVERMIAILCHVSSRTMALYGVAGRRWWPFAIGFAVLTAVDAIAGWAYVSEELGTFSIWWLELALLPIAVASIPLTAWATRHWPPCAAATPQEGAAANTI